MKKLLLAIVLILGLGLCWIYFFIPSEIQISSFRYLKCVSKNASNCINDTGNWKRWWPSSYGSSSRDYKFNLRSRFSDGAEILLTKGSDSFETRVRTVAMGADSTAVEWQINYSLGLNPIQRLKLANEALQLKKNTEIILDHLKRFAEKTENIYGFNIRRTTFKDTLLAAVKFTGKNYPSVKEVYNLIRRIENALSAQNIEAIGFPMLNVNKKDSTLYETMIALPINRSPRPDKLITATRMVTMKDGFLFAEAVGGPAAIQRAHQAIDEYMNDHFLSAPGIPFEILVTDRSKESDTSRWKTIIYYPSM